VNRDDRTDEASSNAGPPDHDPAPRYEIRVKGRLEGRWASWFDGMEITDPDDGTTVLHGTVPDQAALHGLLARLRDVGIPLLSLREVTNDNTTTTEPEGN
jgi:hypothetical protein